MNTTQKHLTPDAVCFAATTLILAEGGTSSLIVQQFLLNQGYQAKRTDVSIWLVCVAIQEGWTIDDNGMFLVFSFPTPTSSSQ
ncbi:hypothetical protein WBJ53_22350 [Spirosoma sp. SC4-14]|uniref:hypothetical protein n=1 Tax=Spirosoma sp. SC4-14 TaxID=3128900 RepID=UPI0030D5C37C